MNKPNYINAEIKKVSEVDLRKALKEVKEKNKAIRESFRLTLEVLNFKCY